ncbi:hypothetical protein BR63_05690 [Thermanaerosceptrum fracticalcis]|uniref:Uncharacterized protein n=1 Tax=Thermanaerosceptrum fracticalcis TaxID=1712410 RepID=A0A7G6E197_THEFR|nr:hypothetical protein [Thermanaerosceptrum fracticalcis]QNB45851.1 hypothetical protein BR63_05690 [Thermanaerosceptrum fracticalcis]
MQLALKWRSLFIKPEDEVISQEPISLGGKVLRPGMVFDRIGENERTAVTMQEGYYLEYAGLLDDKGIKHLLFREYLQDWEGWYQAYIYIDEHTLLEQTSPYGFRDIRCQSLEPVENPKPKKVFRQLCFF